MENQTHNPRRPHALGDRRAAADAAFREKLRQMALPLAPLVQLTTGEIHPAFPGTLLNFWLLTDAQLEELAHFYHQRTPCRWTFHYPCPIAWSSDMPLEEKRRRIGRFIGLRGCETPVVAGAANGRSSASSSSGESGRSQSGSDSESRSSGSTGGNSDEEDSFMEMARRARLAGDDPVWKKKYHWYG